METYIRPLTRDDEPFLWTALYHAIHAPPGSAQVPPEILHRPELARYVAGWMERSDDLGFAAVEADTPIGAAWLRRWPSGDRGFGFVDEATPELSMSVLPGHRGRGTGTALLRRLLDASSRRFEAVSLSVAESNPARRLYEREGFERVGEPEGRSMKMIKRFVRPGSL